MKYLKFLFSPIFMGVLFVLFALSMAIATFLENDYGSPAAYSLIYNAKWFELILLLLAVNLVGQIVLLKLLRKDKLTIALFHLSFILMLVGAGITRYFGWEGSIHIRDGEEQNQCYSNEKYIGYSVKDQNGKIIVNHFQKYSLTSVSSDNFEKKIQINGRSYDLILAKIITNATEIITDSPEGEPIISLLLTKNMRDRETITLKKGDYITSNGITFGFGSQTPADINISVDSGKFFIVSKLNLDEMSMMTKKSATPEQGSTLR